MNTSDVIGWVGVGVFGGVVGLMLWQDRERTQEVRYEMLNNQLASLRSDLNRLRAEISPDK